ncbi:lysosomal alpha-mannosidase-like [Mercenaria mercenaria]|uniref:lysosomal alpha-mannosidase-like n=1 Tax=Mercenaria mercenaria TaxID=6596 RepID=UPI001E1DC299|nr:lysosomal alpha-mannosidase-like [Mercenaria mercenaria]
MAFRGFTLYALAHILYGVASVPIQEKETHSCGYSSCNPVKDDMLNVHLVPHTHDDVGWVKTYEEYYQQDVKKIISSVVENLEHDRLKGGNKRFIYVEMAFLKLWWQDQNDDIKRIVRTLVNEGRLEIILGGWCMNDEATPYYLDIIDQHTLGFQFIRTNFGDCGRPKIGWQIDPFGHSREVASLFAQFGFDGMFIGRIDYQDKRERKRSKTMEMVWRASESLSRSGTDIFVGVLENVYWPPKGFCWDYWCSDPELVNSSNNWKRAKVNEFLWTIKEEAKHYATNHVMVEMGSDFQYRWANKWYENLDELIRLINMRQSEDPNFKINALYSTPSCYLYQLHRSNRTWSVKKDDFFPYAHRPNSFWTGYFTSRPLLKRFVRTAGALLQTCKQLNALAKLEDTEFDMNYLKEAMAVVQHHDGVSGTEKQYVADDYTRLLSNGIHYCKDIIYSAINKLLDVNDTTSPQLQYCDHLPLQACNIPESNNKFSVVLYNPLARRHNYFVRLPVLDSEYEVFNHDGMEIEHQMLPITKETKGIPERPESTAGNDLVFQADLPPLGITTFFIQKKEENDIDIYDIDMLEEEVIELAEESFGPEAYEDALEIIENQFYTVTVDRKTGLISRIWNKQEDVAIQLKQNFFYYVSHSGYNYDGDSQASGAYIFRPTSNRPEDINQGSSVNIISYKGGLVQEIRQVFCSWVSQVIRLYDNQSHIELEWTVGPIPSGDGSEGREVVSKYMTDLETEGILYTDLNGRETLKRKRDVTKSEPVAGNFYPISSRAAIKDERRDAQLTVLVDRSEGAASIHDGNLEIMIHRRTFLDDSLGVEEPLTEYGASGKGIVVRGTHYIMLNKISRASSVYRPLYQKIYLQPFITFSTQLPQYSDWANTRKTLWSGITRALPENVHLLTLDAWQEPVVETTYTSLLLRLENIFEEFEDETMSSPATVDLQNLFHPFHITEVIEMSLGANMKIEDMQRLKWKTKHDEQRYVINHLDNGFIFELTPMQIRTFQINIDNR